MKKGYRVCLFCLIFSSLLLGLLSLSWVYPEIRLVTHFLQPYPAQNISTLQNGRLPFNPSIINASTARHKGGTNGKLSAGKTVNKYTKGVNNRIPGNTADHVNKSSSFQWKRISPKTAYDRFIPLTSERCKNVCDDKTTAGCEARQSKTWSQLLDKGVVRGVPLYDENEYMFPFEKDYLSFPPLVDSKKLPDLDRSIIYHVDRRGGVKKVSAVTCNHMDTVTFRVDLVDSYGKPRQHGGDEVRVWMTGNPKDLDRHDFASAGRVEDLKNGSYLATVKCAWIGYATLKVGVAYSREYIRAALDNGRRGVSVLVTATFVHGDIEEDTLCSSHPNIPGRPCICNFTTWNESPFFCGRPLDKRLSCVNFTYTVSIYGHPMLIATDAERHLSSTSSKFASRTVIHQNVTLTVRNEDARKLPQVPCYQVNTTKSWDFKAPRGFWSNNSQWTSLICKQPLVTSSWIQNCLKDTAVWFIGDSNMMAMYKELKILANCGNKPVWRSGIKFWRNKTKRISLAIITHGYLYHSSYKRRKPKLLGVRLHVDKIPSTGKHFVCLHYYLHPSRSHISATFVRLIELKKTILSLLKRNPNVHIAVRGPHISTREVPRDHILGGDTLGAFILAFYHEIFRDVRDKVLFLDGWDMSIAIENSKYHPDQKMVQQLIRTFLSFQCR